jgi:hypothetical protein
MNDVQKLKESTLATRVKFHWLGVNRKMEQGWKSEMAKMIEADEDSLSIQKRIFNMKIPVLKEMTKIRNSIKEYWDKATLPYIEEGVRLLKKDDLEEFNNTMKDWQEELNKAAHSVQNGREDIIDEAKSRLGKAFNPDNYPDNLATLFGIEWSFPSLEPPEFIAKLNPKLYEEERQKAEARLKEAVELAEQAFLQEMKGLIEHLHEKLSPGPDGSKKQFKESSVKNLHEFFERFQHLNFGSNEEIENLVQEAKAMVAGVSADDLRKSDLLRSDIAQELAGLKEKITPLVVQKPRRAIIKPKLHEEKVA